MISFLFFLRWRSEHQKVKSKNGKVKNKNDIVMSPPLGLRRLMEPSAEEVGLILPVFSENYWILIYLVIDRLTWLTLYECVWEFIAETVGTSS